MPTEREAVRQRNTTTTTFHLSQWTFGYNGDKKLIIVSKCHRVNTHNYYHTWFVFEQVKVSLAMYLKWLSNCNPDTQDSEQTIIIQPYSMSIDSTGYRVLIPKSIPMLFGEGMDYLVKYGYGEGNTRYTRRSKSSSPPPTKLPISQDVQEVLG